MNKYTDMQKKWMEAIGSGKSFNATPRILSMRSKDGSFELTPAMFKMITEDLSLPIDWAEAFVGTRFTFRTMGNDFGMTSDMILKVLRRFPHVFFENFKSL